MIKTSPFADQEREAKLNQLGDALQVMEQQVELRCSCCGGRPCGTAPQPRAWRPSAVPYRTDGAGTVDLAAIQLER
jgi:transposase, IS5 family